jgi:DNA-binding response OmpR family regulator
MGDKHLLPEEKAIPMEEPVLQGKVQPQIDNNTAYKEKREDQVEVRGQPSLLLVEDHTELREYLKEHLEDEFRVLEASNGEEALGILEKQKPDLIITDWIMPVMDGAAFIKEIRSREHTSAIPVILLTARDEMMDQQFGLEVGADQVITKPFNTQLLKTQVRRTIQNYRERLRKFSVENPEHLVEVHENREAYFIGELERVIRAHMRDTSLNAGVIARELGMSRTALYDKIKSITGQTLGEYVQRLRLKHAIKLMLYENVTVSEVYVMVGFSSSSYLIRLFKKYYQTTPGEYVKGYLKKASN